MPARILDEGDDMGRGRKRADAQPVGSTKHELTNADKLAKGMSIAAEQEALEKVLEKKASEVKTFNAKIKEHRDAISKWSLDLRRGYEYVDGQGDLTDMIPPAGARASDARNLS